MAEAAPRLRRRRSTRRSQHRVRAAHRHTSQRFGEMRHTGPLRTRASIASTMQSEFAMHTLSRHSDESWTGRGWMVLELGAIALVLGLGVVLAWQLGNVG